MYFDVLLMQIKAIKQTLLHLKIIRKESLFQARYFYLHLTTAVRLFLTLM
jgi:hypothetical protein